MTAKAMRVIPIPFAVCAAVALAIAAPGPADDSPTLPATFGPFGHLVGAWKGQGIPAANRIRGWNERHQWAWAFEKGEPVGLTIELTGNKILAQGRLTYDEKSKTYRLEGTDPTKKVVAFT